MSPSSIFRACQDRNIFGVTIKWPGTNPTQDNFRQPRKLIFDMQPNFDSTKFENCKKKSSQKILTKIHSELNIF